MFFQQQKNLYGQHSVAAAWTNLSPWKICEKNCTLLSESVQIGLCFPLKSISQWPPPKSWPCSALWQYTIYNIQPRQLMKSQRKIIKWPVRCSHSEYLYLGCNNHGRGRETYKLVRASVCTICSDDNSCPYKILVGLVNFFTVFRTPTYFSSSEILNRKGSHTHSISWILNMISFRSWV